MNAVVTLQNRIPAMSTEAINKVYELESRASQLPQIDIPTTHVLHGGMYARTITLPQASG